MIGLIMWVMPQLDECHKFITLTIKDRGFDFAIVVLQERLDRLSLHPESSDFDLGVKTAMKEDLAAFRVNMTAIAGSIQATEIRMFDEPLLR